MLEHLWFVSEQAGSDVGLEAAATDYLNTVLTHRPNEAAMLFTSDDPTH